MITSFPRLEFLLAALLWGSSFAFQKTLFGNISPVGFTFWNFFIPFIFLFVIVLFRKQSILYKYKEGLILGALLFLLEILQMYGLKYSSAANTAFISNIGMLMIPLLGFVLYKHKVRKVDMIALALALSGMYLLVGGISSFHMGDFLLLLSALAIGFYFLYSEVFEGEKQSHMLVLCTQQFFVISFLCALMIVLMPDEVFSVESGIFFSLGWQIAAFTLIPYLLIQMASKKSNEMTAAMYDGVVEPLVGGIVAWGLFKEVATPTMIVGGLVMVVSFAIANIFYRKKR